MVIWHLKKEAEKRFRTGHPWVFSNELAQSPKGLTPGAAVELRDSRGAFLALGYGHPNSLISFRKLSDHTTALDTGFFVNRLKRAAHLRKLAGLEGFSYRLCFAEGDGLPGLIIDRYLLEPTGQVFVVQSSTAGMDAHLPRVFEALETLASEALANGPTSIILANDSKSRAMEGVAVEPKKIVLSGDGFQGETATLKVQPGLQGLQPLHFKADLLGGQKTGFFLDQRFNIQITSRFVDSLLEERRELRVLDLCCYIGQWGTQLAHLAQSKGAKAQVTCVDASAKALELAAHNVQAHGGEVRIVKADVLEAMEKLEAQAFDVVICDPPAFIKKKKDIPTGAQAYLKMNRSALRRAARGGIYVSCSCSGLFTEEDFRAMLSRLVSEREVRWLARGGHSPDHPQRPEFPQGTYLKAWMGVVG